MASNIDNVFESIEQTKAHLAAQDKKKAEAEKAQKRRELQNSAFMKRMMGGSEDDLKPLTPEETDLLEGRDLAHLTVVNGIVCRIDDAGRITAPESLAGRLPSEADTSNTPAKSTDTTPETAASNIADAVPQSAARDEAPIPPPIPDVKPDTSPDTDIPAQTKAAANAGAGDYDKIPSPPPQDMHVMPAAPIVAKPDQVEILAPKLVFPDRTKIYFATSYNAHLKKGAYAAIIKNADDTETLIGDSMMTDNVNDAAFVGIVKALEKYEILGVKAVTIYAKRELSQLFRRNSEFITDGYSNASGEYLATIKRVLKTNILTVAPRESRLDIQTAVQAAADGLAAEFSKDDSADGESW